MISNYFIHIFPSASNPGRDCSPVSAGRGRRRASLEAYERSCANGLHLVRLPEHRPGRLHRSEPALQVAHYHIHQSPVRQMLAQVRLFSLGSKKTSLATPGPNYIIISVNRKLIACQ